MPVNATANTATHSTPRAPQRAALLQGAARSAFPADYLTALERLPAPMLRACLADMAHLLLPVVLERAERLQMTVNLLVQNQITAIGTQAALHAVGATTVVDMQMGALPTAAEDFRKFAAAIGAPPRLPGLTATESQILHCAKQLSNLTVSARIGVGLASVALTERVWQWLCTYVGDLLVQRDTVVAAVARGCFAPQRRDAQLADALETMLASLTESPAIDRSIHFGMDQTASVLGTLFSQLQDRQRQLIAQGA
jgi:hypothetical protein